MRLKKLAAKVAEYQDRLAAGHASKIEPEHVERVLEKLRRKEADLRARFASDPVDAECEDLQHKLKVAREHIERAEWLRRELA